MSTPRPSRSIDAQAEAIRELLRLLPTAKHIRPSVKDEIRLRAELAIQTVLKSNDEGARKR